ncbi:unnamed protein product, partial [Allacma fusca]
QRNVNRFQCDREYILQNFLKNYIPNMKLLFSRSRCVKKTSYPKQLPISRHLRCKLP